MCPHPPKRSTRQATKSATSGPVKVENGDVAAKVSTTAVSKRKVKEEDESESEEAKPKKRKTAPAKGKAKKEEDMTPLAARTAVASLKKAMYIGAHVSGAGGMAPLS
ncbi:hypothetical protein IMZ48_14110 [Candidatus Bathyarchaeota archaeon]|nr:hypothetical protein [Candidatus Bathyarchaeota archaeon]